MPPIQPRDRILFVALNFLLNQLILNHWLLLPLHNVFTSRNDIPLRTIQRSPFTRVDCLLHQAFLRLQQKLLEIWRKGTIEFVGSYVGREHCLASDLPFLGRLNLETPACQAINLDLQVIRYHFAIPLAFLWELAL